MIATAFHLLQVANAFQAATGDAMTAISNRATGDPRKLGQIQAGADITTKRLEAAFAWFSANWPDKAKWPREIERPLPTPAEAAE